MKEFFDKIKSATSVISGVVAVITIVITGYKAYDSLIDRVDKNLGQIEKTQMMILKKNVREYEAKVCTSSEVEWDEYLANYSLLYELKIRHGHLSPKTPWKPIIRITKVTEDEICTR